MGSRIGNSTQVPRLTDINWTANTGAIARSFEPLSHWFAAKARGIETGHSCKRSSLAANVMFGKNLIIDPTDTDVIPFSGAHFNVMSPATRFEKTVPTN
jgi:hypothetical protein